MSILSVKNTQPEWRRDCHIDDFVTLSLGTGNHAGDLWRQEHNGDWIEETIDRLVPFLIVDARQETKEIV
jgi:hypothetical protein